MAATVLRVPAGLAAVAAVGAGLGGRAECRVNVNRGDPRRAGQAEVQRGEALSVLRVGVNPVEQGGVELVGARVPDGAALRACGVAGRTLERFDQDLLCGSRDHLV